MNNDCVSGVTLAAQGHKDVETGLEVSDNQTSSMNTVALDPKVALAPTVADNSLTVKNADVTLAYADGAVAACESGQCGAKEQQTRRTRCPCCTRKVRCCSACLVLTAATCGTLIGLFYPRDPDWNIKELGMNATTLAAFADVVSGKGNPDAVLEFSPKVTFWNPNRLGTLTESGNVAIRFGEHLIGHASVDSSVVAPSSSGIVQVHNQVRLGVAAPLMFKHMSDNAFELPVECDGKLTVAKVGPLSVDAKIHCHVLSDALQVLGDHEQIIKEKKCTYSYSFRFGDE